jgi:alkyldihydroxyacetonephosphate synthase
MRRWNSWGNEDSEYTMALSENLRQVLEALVGPGHPLPEATLEQALGGVPESRLPEHPLIDRSAETRLRHARGQSLPDWLAVRSGEFGFFPDGVAIPGDAAEVAELLRFALDHDVTVIPYGGGTSVAGHINPQGGARPVLTVSLAGLDRLIALDTESQLATFGAGTPGPEIERLLQAEGYTLGHYPQSWELSTVGGWVASRSSGQQSLRYGRIEQMFAGCTMETPAGTLQVPSVPASSAGPDIREMVLGSEGRLGIITEVKVRVTPLPEREFFHVIFFPDWNRGMNAARTLVQQCVPLSMVRLSNAMETISLLHMGSDGDKVATLEAALAAQGVGGDKVMMTLGFTGTHRQCEASLEQVLHYCAGFGGVDTGTELGENWAHGRFRAPYLREPLGMAGYAVDTMETAVDWVRVSRTMEDVETAIRGALQEETARVHVYSHLSHVYGQGSSVYTTYIFPYAESYAATLARWQKLKSAGAGQIVANGGTISHQHGVGADHRQYLAAEKGALGIAAIRSLCELFDPDGHMNPGKLLPDPPAQST